MHSTVHSEIRMTETADRLNQVLSTVPLFMCHGQAFRGNVAHFPHGILKGFPYFMAEGFVTFTVVCET